jgi:hypothetical protein
MPYFPGAYFPPAYFPSGYFGGAGAAPADRRFTRFFTHRADLWEPAFPIPAGGCHLDAAGRGRAGALHHEVSRG